VRQCNLLGIARSSFYYEPVPESAENLHLMRAIDELYLKYPFYGARRILQELASPAQALNLKRIRRLMKRMGLEALYPKPHLSTRDQHHEVYPYLLKHLIINQLNQVWASDITYIPRQKGFLYLVAIIDLYSRFIIGYRLSNSLSEHFWIDCLQNALQNGQKPPIFNPDQGSQFTSIKFTQVLKNQEVKISMDSKGRALDNIFIERFWRTLKYEYIYLHTFENGAELQKGLHNFIQFYNFERKHQALGYLTPADIYIHHKQLTLKSTKNDPYKFSLGSL
jgi:putative transposase